MSTFSKLFLLEGIISITISKAYIPSNSMEIKIRRRPKNLDDKSVNNRPHILIIFFLSTTLILSTIGLIKDLRSVKGLRPFGFIEDAIAQVIGQSNSSALPISSNPKRVLDNTDRCVAINPANGKPYRNASGVSSNVTGKAGINQGEVGAGVDKQIEFIQGNNSLGQDLGMGFILTIFTGPDVEGAVDFITKSNDAGLIPVVRLCYPGNCSFRMDDGSIPSFYESINSQLQEGYEFVGLVGPNEPGTANEMESFGVKGDYQFLFDRVTEIAEKLQYIRVANGGKMYIAPIAFNSTNTQNDDITEFLINRNLNTELFDYLLLNIYDTKDDNSYNLYENTRPGFSFKNYAEENGIQVILSEFGLFDTAIKLDQFKQNFNNFCNDSTVDGMLFFRSSEELGRPDGPNPDAQQTKVLAELSQNCTRQRQWLNCNFDSAIYPDHPKKQPLVPDALSQSSPMCVKNEENNSKGAGLLVQCNGNECSARAIKTIQAKLPVKQFGSNSSFGTRTRSYTPICAEVASYLGDTNFDALNQFAGELTGGGIRYPMPLLGNAINCASELVKYSPDFARFSALQAYPSPGSLSSNIDDEISGDKAKEVDNTISYIPASRFKVDGSSILIPDERIVSIDGNHYDKTDQLSIKNLRTYDPYKTINNYQKLPNSCNNEDIRYINNSDDYILGPEVVVGEETVWSGSGGELCRLYGERNHNSSGVMLETNSQLDCRINPTRTIPVSIPSGATIQARCVNLFSCDFNSGSCNIDPYYSQCIDYTPKPTDKVYIYTKNYPTVPRFNIQDIWDALYNQYNLIQDNLETRGMKMVFRENIAWKTEYFGIIRDANRSVADPEPYLYSSTPQELDYSQGEISGNAFQPDLFQNNALYARGKSTIKSEQYHEWLGYVDIIQELRMVYADSTSLSAERRIGNPFFGQDGEPNNDRAEINITGIASQFTSFPVLTCDQVNICKKYSNQELKDMGFNEDLADSLCPFERLPEDAELTCITDIGDKRAQNELELQLCRKGYRVEGKCNDTLQCIPQDSIVATNPDAAGDLVYETSACPAPECLAQLQEGRGGYAYPSCNNGIQTTGTGAVGPVGNCAYWQTQEIYFGRAEDVADNLVSLSALSVQADGDGFLGINAAIPVHKNAAEIFLRAEQEFNRRYGADRQGSTYYLPSYPNGYKFTFARSYVPESNLGSGAPSNHAYGVAIDINAETNWGNFRPNTGSCIIDIPPELVAVFEAYGIRWGGRFSKQGFEVGSGETGYFDPMHFEIVPACAPNLISSPAQIPDSLPAGTTSDYACVIDTEEISNIDNIKCNEWNCNMREFTTFGQSLQCVTSIGYFHGTMDEWIDRYGPFCDNETRRPTLPFAYNFARFYDKYLAPGTPGGRTCGELPPSEGRDEDVGMACPAFGERVGTPEYEYYRGALSRCSIPVEQTYWTPQNSFGMEPEELANYLVDTLDLNYNGMYLRNTPREKVVRVLLEARAKNKNPFIVLGIWGTESWFGQYNDLCNQIPE